MLAGRGSVWLPASSSVYIVGALEPGLAYVQSLADNVDGSLFGYSIGIEGSVRVALRDAVWFSGGLELAFLRASGELESAGLESDVTTDATAFSLFLGLGF